MRIQEIQRSPIKYNIAKGQKQSIAFGKSNKISRAAGDAIGCLGVFLAIFQIPIIAGLMCLKTHYDFEQERKDDIRVDEILRQISDAAYPNFVSSLDLLPEVRKLIKEEPFFFKDNYWAEKIPELTQKGIKQWQETEAGVKKQVQEEIQAAKRHIEHVKTIIKSGEFQDYLSKSKRREEEFKSQNPNKKPFKIYNLSYSECNYSTGGIIAQINEYAIKDNARKVQVGSETTVVLVNSGIYTRLGQNLKKKEYKTTPIYKMVYPDDIISFAHHDEENMRIVIHSYKK